VYTPDSPLLLVPSPAFLHVLEPSTTNLQTLPIAALHTNAATASTPHRAKISGTVTYCDPDLIFIQDETAAVRIQPLHEPALTVGDQVEITGFPDRYHSILILSEAHGRKIGQQARVQPRPLDLNASPTNIPNQSLVRIRASLLAQKVLENSQTFDVQTGQRVFQAVLNGKERLPPIPPESLLELTGVCMMDLVPAPSAGPSLENASIGAVRILLRDSADVVVVRGPPWWSWKKAAVIIGILIVSLTGAILRVQFLRHRFEKQQAARLAFARQLLENQESERRRIAANLHDTLGQNLLAIKNQTHLAMQSASDTALQRRLEDISGTVLHALEEVRQITHDLRPYQLDRLGLSQAVRSLVRKVSEGCPIELASHVDNIDGLFPKDSEINIYRIVQEGINNVIKHSQATEAAVVLKVELGTLRISIRDNGRGLNAGQSAEDGSTSGFGLSGIRERARIMKGNVQVDAPPGNGFNLTVEIPIPAAVSRSEVSNHRDTEAQEKRALTTDPAGRDQ
jgi:signal transduction histidine kinase